MSPTYRANQKDEERNYNVTLAGIMTAIALSFLLLGGTYCLRRKFVCRKEKQKRKLITNFFTVRVILVHPHLLHDVSINLYPSKRIRNPGSTDKKSGIHSMEPQS